MHTTKSGMVLYSLEQEDEGQSREDRPGTPIYKVAAVCRKRKRYQIKKNNRVGNDDDVYLWYEDTQNDGE